MDSKSSRISRRRAQARERIIEAAARLFADKGIDEVSLDEIAQEADFSRGTLYSHFPSKEALVFEILRPVLIKSSDKILSLTNLEPRDTVDALLKLYIELWQDHKNALRLIYKIRRDKMGSLAGIHDEFLQNIIKLFEKIQEKGLLRINDPRLSALVMHRIAVPLLEIFDAYEEFEAYFNDSLRSLLIIDKK
ncbi:MAG: TetR/AcrR family transcriptional regulator [Desulfotomaculaceae bacterium]|nr:TetR/AcrR family transcriptional regulator [Desulfotomaculaceae bacterium]